MSVRPERDDDDQPEYRPSRYRQTKPGVVQPPLDVRERINHMREKLAKTSPKETP
jgi:hypothetical protein